MGASSGWNLTPRPPQLRLILGGANGDPVPSSAAAVELKLLGDVRATTPRRPVVVRAAAARRTA